MQLLPVVAAVRLRAPRIIRIMLAPLCWLTAASLIAGFSSMTEHTQSAFALAAVSGSVLLSATHLCSLQHYTALMWSITRR
jgi:hypothetical protein